jgi:hypothetical protein
MTVARRSALVAVSASAMFSSIVVSDRRAHSFGGRAISGDLIWMKRVRVVA